MAATVTEGWRVPIRELSHHTARCMTLVKAGETLDITERGRIIGRIIPVNSDIDIRARLVANGCMRTASRGHADLLIEVGRRLLTEPVDNDAAVRPEPESAALTTRLGHRSEQPWVSSAIVEAESPVRTILYLRGFRYVEM